jgi:hypothetical protein
VLWLLAGEAGSQPFHFAEQLTSDSVPIGGESLVCACRWKWLFPSASSSL